MTRTGTGRVCITYVTLGTNIAVCHTDTETGIRVALVTITTILVSAVFAAVLWENKHTEYWHEEKEEAIL